MIPWIRRNKNLIVTRTFSKAAGLAGLRLGCIFVNRELAAVMRKAQSPYPVNSAALAAGEAAMRDRGFIARTVREVHHGRQELEHGLARLGVRYFPSGGNFVLVHFGERTKKIVGALTRKGTLVRDRSSDFGGEGYVRITLGSLSADAAFVARAGSNSMRKANLRRKTKETDIRLRLNLDGQRKSAHRHGHSFLRPHAGTDCAARRRWTGTCRARRPRCGSAPHR